MRAEVESPSYFLGLANVALRNYRDIQMLHKHLQQRPRKTPLSLCFVGISIQRCRDGICPSLLCGHRVLDTCNIG